MFGGLIAYTAEPPKTRSPPGSPLAPAECWYWEELSNGDLDCRRNRDRALPRAVDSVLRRIHPSRKGARTHLVHVVEAAGSSRHWPGCWWRSTDSTRRRRCSRSSLLTPPHRAQTARRGPRALGDASPCGETGISQRPSQVRRIAPLLHRVDARRRG